MNPNPCTRNLAVGVLAIGIAVVAAAAPHGSNLGQLVGWDTGVWGVGFTAKKAETAEVGKDAKTRRHGKASATICATTNNDPDLYRSFTQVISADAYRGKRVRLQASIKTRNTIGAGLWMRVDGIDHIEGFDSMPNRQIVGTSNWTVCSVVLDVPKTSVAITLGATMKGPGQMWLNDFSLQAVDPAKFKETGGWLGPDYSNNPLTPKNLDFTAPPKPLPISAPGWKTVLGTSGGSVYLDTQTRHADKPSICMRRPEGQDLVALFQQIRADRYRGKRVEYTAYIKSSDKVDAGPFVAIPGGGQLVTGQISQFVEQGTKWVKDTREWKPVTCVVDIPEWARCFQIGVNLNGTGKIWVNDSSLKVVGASTPLTFAEPLEKLYNDAKLKSLPKQPRNLDFGE